MKDWLAFCYKLSGTYWGFVDFVIMDRLLRKIFFIVCCALMSSAAMAQSNSTPLEDIANSLKNNRISDLVKYFDNMVPITINNTQSVYGHNQAEIVLRDYFEKNNPKDLIVLDNGSPNPSSKFMIANFLAHNEKFSIYVLVKLKSNTYMIQEIRLNREQ